jgi:protease-4
VLGVLLRIAWLAAWVVALPWLVARRLLGRAPTDSYLSVEIHGAVEEAPPRPRLWPPSASPPFSLHRLRLLVDEVARDPRVRGLVVVLHSLRGGFATATSLRQVLARARAAGKRVVVHLPRGGGTKETFVAAGSDRLLLGPGATLASVGLLSSGRYLRGALDRAGIVPDVYAQGRFKTAAERFERSSMSEAQREQLDAMLDRIHADVLAAIAEGRGVDASRATALVDGAPYSGVEAVEAGLVDAVAYEDELSASLSDTRGKSVVRPADAYLKVRTALRPGALRARGVVAVIRVHGAIVSAPGFPLGAMAVDDHVISAVRIARASPRVRGVVLHVNSPGGSAFASDRIHHELVQLAAEKPLVACLGDVAASGGYYVAAAAHEIVAQPTTITGSIGVVSARMVIEPLLARLGVATEVLQRGANARLLDPLLPLGDGERRALERELERTYRAFVGIVAAGRKRPADEIEALAQGRVWIGSDAHARGLVDRLGGFEDALDAVRSRIGRSRLRVVVLRPPRALFPALDPPEQKARRAAAGLVGILAEAIGVDASMLALRGERVLAWAADAGLLM